MSQKLLDTKGIHIVFQSMSSKRMSECMNCSRSCNSSCFLVLTEKYFYAVGAEISIYRLSRKKIIRRIHRVIDFPIPS